MKGYSYNLKKISSVLPLVALLISAESASAIDILGERSIDAKSGMSVKSAETIDEGSVHVRGAYSRYRSFGLFGRNKVSKITVQDGKISLGVTEGLELGLSASHTTETPDLEVREEAFSDSDGKFTPAGFSKASLEMKYNFVSGTNISSGVALDVSSKSDASGSASVSRSTSPTGGWLALMTVKYPEFVSLHLNAGMHYRYPELVAEYKIQNETLYGAGLAIHLGDHLDLFGQSEGRTLQIKDTTEENGKYTKVASVVNSGGVKINAGSADLAISAGRDSRNKEFGSAHSIVKLAISYTFGGDSNSSIDDSSDDEESADAPIRQQVKTKPRTLEDDVKEVNFLRNMESAEEEQTDREIDDFELMERKSRSQKAKKDASEEELADQELERLRNMEAQHQKRVEKSRRVESEQNRRRNKKAYDAEQQEYKNLYKDVKHEADEIPTITRDEVEWKGLEE
ncbi:MAG: hypothetical protein AB7T49_05325 [Oligoflexales bacterium]